MRSRRRLRIVAVVMGVFAVPAVVAASYLSDPQQPPPVARAYVDCRPYQEPRGVSDINRFIAHERSTPGFAGGDVGASTRLVDGRSLWVFGDTLRPADAPGPTMVRNSILLMGNGCTGIFRPADGLAAIPDRDDGVGYWPTTVDSGPDGRGGSRVVVGLMRVKATGAGQWDFTIVGASAARFDVPANGVPVLDGVVDLGPDNGDMSRPLWSAAATLADDGTVYLYGTATTGEPLVFGYSLHVARTTVAGLLKQNTWQYWDGKAWNAEPSSVATLVPAVDGVSRALSVFERDGTWYAVSKKLDVLGSSLVIWSAPSPHGPFVASAPVADLPTNDKWMTYLALAHPEVLPKDGSVVVSWSVNSTRPGVVEKDPTAYRPKFRRVPLP